MTEAIYYAEGNTVWKRPIHTKRKDGGSSITVGFPVCTVTDYVGEDGAKTLAEMLCIAEEGTNP